MEAVGRWDQIEVDWAAARVRNLTAGLTLPFAPPTPHARRLIEAGGLLASLRSAALSRR